MKKKKQEPKLPAYTPALLKDLVAHLSSLTDNLQKENKHDIVENLETLTKFLKATYYDPMIFEDWVQVEGTFAAVLLYPHEDLPLLVSGDNEMRDILVKWRFTKGI